MKEQIEAIRQACIKANPSILDLKFGCKVRNKKYGFENTIAIAESDKIAYCPREMDHDFHFDYKEYFDNGDIEILGRDIHLADVLLAIKETNPEYYFVGRGTDDSGTEEIIDNWNCSKDTLDEQSPETIEFIYNLIK